MVNKVLAGVRGSDPETGMNTFHEKLYVLASDYDAKAVNLAAAEEVIEKYRLDFSNALGRVDTLKVALRQCWTTLRMPVSKQEEMLKSFDACSENTSTGVT